MTIARGIHLFPFRTQKLSLLAPNVLGWKRPGRIGRCRFFIKQKSKRKRAGAAQAASAFSFFACLRGHPDPLRCCFPLFPRRVARERAMLYRGNSPLSACAALRARQSPCSKCAHRKVRFSVAGIKLYLGAASRCRTILTRKNSPLPPSLARQVALVRKTCTASFRGNACKNAVLPRLILSKNRKGKGSTAYRCSGLSDFCLFEGKTRPAPLLFSPLSAASCARARYALPRKFTPFRLRCAPCKAAALLKVRSPKSAIFGGGKSHNCFF